MTKNRRLFASLMLAGFASMGTSVAALVATDLNDGGTDTGFSGGWAGSGNRYIITAPDLTYANYGITQTGTVQKVYGGNNTHPDRMDSRDLAAAMTGEIWFSVLVNVPTGGGFAGLSFHSDTLAATSPDYSHNAADLRVVMSPSELWVDWEGGVTNATWTPDATVAGFSAGTHLLLGQMTVGVGTDSLNVWVDPDVNAAGGPGGLPAATYSNSTIDFTDSIVRIGVPINVNVEDTADAIRMSNTTTAFADVTGVVPEPSAALLGGLGLLALLRRRR